MYAILTRYHEQGRLASALFELDLEERGIIKAELRADWRPGEFEDFLGQLGEEIEPMEMCEPGLVVKLVEAAAELGAETLPEGYHAAHALCDGVAPDGPEILVGLEPTEETERPQEGLWSRMKKTMGFSKAP